MLGLPVHPRLARMIAGDFAETKAPDVLAYFARPGGGLLRAGDTLKNPAYAEFLGRLAEQGPAALYQGQTADQRFTMMIHAVKALEKTARRVISGSKL